jgi:hypothetical protein
MNLLICGDSFSADWRVEYPDAYGWPNLLAKDYNVTNLSTAGSSEYRIWKNLKTQNLKNYDLVIVSHTSPYRLYVKTHPVHSQGKLHQNSDFIYTDVVNHGINVVADYFEHYYDLAYAIDIHQLIMMNIASICKNVRCLHIKHIDVNHPVDLNVVDFSLIWKKHPGLINHYSENGNTEIYENIKNMLKLQ